VNAEPLSIVTFARLREVWSSVRDRIDAIRVRDEEPWLADDVFHEILVGNAYLWTTPRNDGFVVLQVAHSPYVKDLHVWIACNRTEARAPEYRDQLKSIAADNRCTRLTFASTRKGWLRTMPDCKVVYLLVEDLGG